MKRIKIEEREEYSLCELSGKLSDIVLWLDHLNFQGWETINTEPDYEGDSLIVVSRYREETDKEFEKRKKKLQINKELQKKLKTEREKKDFALYEKLKQKYEQGD